MFFAGPSHFIAKELGPASNTLARNNAIAEV